ncbi:hypothetical protein FQN60_017118 [Etheostoma spectabile]|uniref:Fork-head domain-containing protein n=1 Tax=Etheostoma spectabile TaxID=54343 RepID=A0A5J5DEL2_9PERO|nr:hypothetical protein FQN60_017118 [Etheostoma spectabile]
MEDDELDTHQVDSDFEPQSRPRSCTWPLPCPEDFPGGQEVSGVLPLANIKVEPEDVPACIAGLVGGTPGELKHPAGAPAPTGTTHPCLAGAALDVTGPLRKAKSSRRNAWGNQSYADLITRAIESTPEKRLTLSQIYDWMVRYVPYFKDKGDSNSSAGWKGLFIFSAKVLVCYLRNCKLGGVDSGSLSFWAISSHRRDMGPISGNDGALGPALLHSVLLRLQYSPLTQQDCLRLAYSILVYTLIAVMYGIEIRGVKCEQAAGPTGGRPHRRDAQIVSPFAPTGNTQLSLALGERIFRSPVQVSDALLICQHLFLPTKAVAALLYPTPCHPIANSFLGARVGTADDLPAIGSYLGSPLCPW